MLASLTAVDYRTTALSGSRVLLLAKEGVVARSVTRTIKSFGGRCLLASTPEAFQTLTGIDQASGFTDVIVDHRVAAQWSPILAKLERGDRPRLRRILLVNPEDRAAQPQDDFDAWLIRPLRQTSLIDVLSGRLKGRERRGGMNDNHPRLDLAPVDAMAVPVAPAHQAPRLLVAEDDPVNARILRAIFEKAGCLVTVVDDFAALKSALAEPCDLPDLVISDLEMPGGVGTELLPQIKLQLQQKGVPLMVLSADARGATSALLHAAGIDDVWLKPADPQALLQRLAGLFPAHRSGEN